MDILKDRIKEEMKTAMKGGNKAKLAVIRLIMAAIKQREVDERIELDDQQIISVLDKMLKQRRESIRQYENANRNDLAEVEQEEILVIQEFLPQPLTESEIDALILTAISETGAQTIKDMGKVMNELKAKMQGRADMSEVSAKIKSNLAG